MNIFLIGYRCVGKTTVGRSIARMMGRSFIDSDMLIVQESGRSIQKIIDTEGWNVFRLMERSTLKNICKKDRQVVATGGGMVLNPDNVKKMKKSGLIIWLRATTQTILERSLQDEKIGNLRPALTDKGLKKEIEETLLARNPYYENTGDIIMNTDGIGVAEISKTLIQKIKDIGMENLF